MTGNWQTVQRLLNDRQLEIVKCVSPLTTISGTYQWQQVSQFLFDWQLETKARASSKLCFDY